MCQSTIEEYKKNMQYVRIIPEYNAYNNSARARQTGRSEAGKQAKRI
jgi:hypothetical protein